MIIKDNWDLVTWSPLFSYAFGWWFRVLRELDINGYTYGFEHWLDRRWQHQGEQSQSNHLVNGVTWNSTLYGDYYMHQDTFGVLNESYVLCKRVFFFVLSFFLLEHLFVPIHIWFLRTYVITWCQAWNPKDVDVLWKIWMLFYICDCWNPRLSSWHVHKFLNMLCTLAPIWHHNIG